MAHRAASVEAKRAEDEARARKKADADARCGELAQPPVCMHFRSYAGVFQAEQMTSNKHDEPVDYKAAEDDFM